jgi:hypothetical protein
VAYGADSATFCDAEARERPLQTADIDYRAAIASWERALAEFQAASSVIQAQMLAGAGPSTADFLREEVARARLFAARRVVLKMPWLLPARAKQPPAESARQESSTPRPEA